jgi:hypothetical protein
MVEPRPYFRLHLQVFKQRQFEFTGCPDFLRSRDNAYQAKKATEKQFE